MSWKYNYDVGGSFINWTTCFANFNVDQYLIVLYKINDQEKCENLFENLLFFFFGK